MTLALPLWRDDAWCTFGLALLVILGLGLVATPALAQVCEPADTQDSLQYLRRLSLDLRGRLPALEELESVVTNGELDPAIIEGMLASDEFVDQLDAYHRDLLWANVENQRLTIFAWQIFSAGRRGQGSVLYLRANARAGQYRGGQVPCLQGAGDRARILVNGEEVEVTDQAQLDGAEIVTEQDENDPRINREGWVEVEPYWAPGTMQRVCAFDAQVTVSAPAVASPRNPNPTGIAKCDSAAGNPSCGCGPNLRWCQAPTFQTEKIIDASFGEQLLRFVGGIVREGRPYTDILLAKDIEINGPISHYLRYQSQTGSTALFSSPEQGYDVPVLNFTDYDVWERSERTGRHAGVLTLPAYLIKFQSNRGRVNRFYNAFLCSPFQAPSGGLPPADDVCHDEPNLSKRCGCQYCHTTIEPAAAHWGRWLEAGLLPLDEESYPRYGEGSFRGETRPCSDPRADQAPFCRRFYFTQANHPDEEPYRGQLLAYVFTDEERTANIDAGPAKIGQEAIDSGRFASCSVRKLWTHFLARAPGVADEERLDELSAAFVEGGYDITDLVGQIVSGRAYRSGEALVAEEVQL